MADDDECFSETVFLQRNLGKNDFQEAAVWVLLKAKWVGGKSLWVRLFQGQFQQQLNFPALQRVENKDCDDNGGEFPRHWWPQTWSPAGFPFQENLPTFFASNLLLTLLDSPGLSAAVSEMPKREKACEEFGRDLSDSNTPIYFSSLEFLGPVFADEIYKQTGWTEGGWGQERVVAASQVLQQP